MDLEKLRDWFRTSKRDFPWRRDPSPYQVLISEIMLQQTQAAVVIPYFEKWLSRFPTLADLAKAEEEEVIKQWEGLGYYSRARALHRAAQMIMEKFGGKIPSDEEELHSIPGIGPYTQGALRSFAFHQKAVAIDGNVLRVLSRFFRIEEEISRPSTRRIISQHAFDLLPDEKPWEISEAWIELGATVCQKKPDCLHCPLKEGCLARAGGVAEILPTKKKPPPITELNRNVAIIFFQDMLLLRKNEQGLMKDLWEFPYFEPLQSEKNEIESLIGSKPILIDRLPEVTHSFTRYRATLVPKVWKVKECRLSIAPYQWVAKEKLARLSFSSGHRKLLRYVLEQHEIHFSPS